MTIFDRLTPRLEGQPPKPELTNEEKALWARAQAAINSILRRHGISLAPNEVPWIGAEVADFVVSEMPKPVAAEVPKPVEAKASEPPVEVKANEPAVEAGAKVEAI